MYRFGDGTPFPLEDNFIETLTSAVETCSAAFMPLTELDSRRERAKQGRIESEKEIARLTEFEKTLTGALAPYMTSDRKSQAFRKIAPAFLPTFWRT